MSRGLPATLGAYPGAVLIVGRDGRVVESNGRLEEALGRPLGGVPFADLLDAESSGAKWIRLFAELGDPSAVAGTTWEFILAAGDRALTEPRRFVVLPDPDGGALWLVEHPVDPRLDDLRERVVGVNSELAGTQRELVKERGRLAAALAELEEQMRVSEALRRTVEAQNVELERSNDALDEFAHVISHDLKEPLRGIDSYASWLAEDLGDDLPSDSAEHLERLRDRVAHLRRMIDGVLAYARAGRSAGEALPVDVRALVEGVVRLVAPGPEVAVEVGDLPVLETERAPLEQTFLNLVGNAVRYAGRSSEPRVRVEVRDGAEGPTFSVTDNGPGIPPDQHERVWGLFRTLEPPERAEGTGIGLAVVKKLVEAHGGRVWVESEPGRGATFRFTWPGKPRETFPDDTERDGTGDDG